MRQEYTTLRTGIVKLQAVFKMKRQKSRYGEMLEQRDTEQKSQVDKDKWEMEFVGISPPYGNEMR